MTDRQGTLDRVVLALVQFFAPLEQRLASGNVRVLFAELGLQFPPALETVPSVTTATENVVGVIRQSRIVAPQLVKAIEDEDRAQAVARSVDLIHMVRTASSGIDTIANALRTAGAATGLPASTVTSFADELPGRLLEYLTARSFETLPGLPETLEFIGVLERREENVGSVDPARPPFTRRSVHLDQLSSFINSPKDQLEAKYGWGASTFDGVTLLQTLQQRLVATNVPAIVDTSVTPPVLDVYFIELSPKTDVEPPGLQLKIVEPIRLNAPGATFAQDEWQVQLVAGALLPVGSTAVVQPNDQVSVVPPAPTVLQGDTSLEWKAGGAGRDPIVIVGEAGKSRLEARELVARAGVGFAWDAINRRAQGEFKILGEIRNGKLVIDLSNADGFLGSILGGFGLESDFNVGFGFSTRDGLFFQGSATLDIQLPIHISLGAVELSALTLTIGVQNNTFPIGLALDIKAALGPLQAVVQEVGMRADVSIPADRNGNAGPVDIQLRFKPPKGVGLSIDAGVIKGGGFLSIDPERGEYAGALELSFAEVISLTAIGLITTRMPDGSSGFSLLIIITADFGTGIQLGFGFTLLAVGGLLGLNRTVRLQALMEGIRTGAVESIMFPRDVIANAPRIISDLRTIFPPQPGLFLIGPMAKIGWGTPALISISLGIIIEIPGNIAILGILKIAIPADEIPLIVLQVNFAGAIEFDRRRIYFFAALFESRIVFITIEGEMGLLMDFSDDPNFVASVGGFHPRFNPPPLPFPSPRRIEVSLLNTPLSRVRIEGYFAVTTNTLQFGARVEVFFGAGDVFNVQGHLTFDALFQRSPFYFVFEISASLSVRVFGIGLFSVGIRGTFDGPRPYHIKGKGSISLLFWDIDIPIDETWGESGNTILPPIPVLPFFRSEIDKPENWQALLPKNNNLLVALRKLKPEENPLVLHPLGVLRISQRALPLELKLDRVGAQTPSDVNRLSIAVAGSALVKIDDAFEKFAPAQFQNFSDSDKLTRPAFAPERSGLNLSAEGANLRSSIMVKRKVRYEEIIIDNNFKRFKRRFTGFTGALFTFFLGGNAATRCHISAVSKAQLKPFEEKITVIPDTYTVALQSNNTAFAADSISFHSEASARDYLSRKIGEDPSLEDQIHVIPSFERAA